MPLGKWSILFGELGMPGRAQARTNWIVKQFGFATIPLFGRELSTVGFTCGTTKGISSFILNARELSMTNAPCAVNRGAHCRLIAPPAEKKTISKAASLAFSITSIGQDLPRNVS